jgi:hypothetical protein
VLRLRNCLPACAISIALAAVAVTPNAAAAVPAEPCGAHAPEALANSAGMVAKRIYFNELGGGETLSDKRQVETYGPLIEGVEKGDHAKIRKAIFHLLYSHTHIVRLRIARAGKVLEDIGGPFTIAPVHGVLRSHGRSIAQYVLTVQDDVGYRKLVTRLIGVPIEMRLNGKRPPVEGLAPHAPAQIPDLGPVTYLGRAHEAFSFDARGFPDELLRISLLVPVPSGLAERTCAQIRSAEIAHIAQLVSLRFDLGSTTFATYLKLMRTLTDGLFYVRAGTKQLAGTTSPGPASLPSSGGVDYDGHSYEVSSFVPKGIGGARVYVLIESTP